MKQCSKCGEIKDLSGFYKNSKSDKYRSACKSCSIKHTVKYHQTHGKEVKARYDSIYYKTEQLLKKRREYRAINDNKVKNIIYQTEYRQKYPEKGRYYRAKYRAAKLLATPIWLTDKQLSQIEYYYNMAKLIQDISGEETHVDHIIPLQGKEVCGLHVPWNLQILSRTDNLKKSNRIS